MSKQVEDAMSARAMMVPATIPACSALSIDLLQGPHLGSWRRWPHEPLLGPSGDRSRRRLHFVDAQYGLDGLRLEIQHDLAKDILVGALHAVGEFCSPQTLQRLPNSTLGIVGAHRASGL
jgi:hypothetical protein